MPRARRPRPSSRSAVASWALAAGVTISLAGCGKKGPPLAPLQQLPARIEDLSMTRSNNEVQARFTLPIANQDGTQPASLSAVELYALSGKPEDPFGNPLNAADFLRYATLITRVEVEPPPEPEDEPPPTLNPDGTPAPPPPPKPAPPPDPRPAQGETITLREETDAGGDDSRGCILASARRRRKRLNPWKCRLGRRCGGRKRRSSSRACMSRWA